MEWLVVERAGWKRVSIHRVMPNYGWNGSAKSSRIFCKGNRSYICRVDAVEILVSKLSLKPLCQWSEDDAYISYVDLLKLVSFSIGDSTIGRGTYGLFSIALACIPALCLLRC